MVVIPPMARKNPPRQVAWRLFLQAHALLTRRIHARLVEAGCISYDTYDVLITLAEAEGQRLRMSELAEATYFSNSGISRRVGRLESEGYLRREGSAEDGRVFYAVLTEEGREALREAWPVYEAAIGEEFGRSLSVAEAGQWSGLMRQVLQGIGVVVGKELTEEPPV